MTFWHSQRIEGKGLALAKEPVNVNETIANAIADAKIFVLPDKK